MVDTNTDAKGPVVTERNTVMIDLGRIKKRKQNERLIESVFFMSAFVAVMSVVVITLFIFMEGVPALVKIGLTDFIFGMKWQPLADVFGILPMIVGSLYATLGAILLGVPIGIMTAVFIAEVAPDWIVKIVKPAVELLAGIPSVIYGFFGLIIIVPMIDKYLGGGGNSLLAAIFILGVMILPTVISISETSIRAVPSEYKEGALALGASKIQMIFKTYLH